MDVGAQRPGGAHRGKGLGMIANLALHRVSVEPPDESVVRSCVGEGLHRRLLRDPACAPLTPPASAVRCGGGGRLAPMTREQSPAVVDGEEGRLYRPQRAPRSMTMLRFVRS